jgi:hypothetical protein
MPLLQWCKFSSRANPCQVPTGGQSAHKCQHKGCSNQAIIPLGTSSDIYAFCGTCTPSQAGFQYRDATDPGIVQLHFVNTIHTHTTLAYLAYVARCKNVHGPCNNIGVAGPSGSTDFCGMRCFIQFQSMSNPAYPKCFLPGCGKPGTSFMRVISVIVLVDVELCISMAADGLLWAHTCGPG